VYLFLCLKSIFEFFIYFLLQINFFIKILNRFDLLISNKFKKIYYFIIFLNKKYFEKQPLPQFQKLSTTHPIVFNYNINHGNLHIRYSMISHMSGIMYLPYIKSPT
jgi:hypothetical protein